MNTLIEVIKEKKAISALIVIIFILLCLIGKAHVAVMSVLIGLVVGRFLGSLIK
jgi:hypothetical protein